ncbi:ATP/GTP-binding protein [Fervidicoccus fontis]|uniref:ATP/GTP-binding protein n=2 Tax=Fervidicoccus fontis TaxID=683846 RepID=A0A2J6N221_9CREN|nr:ATP/GTP-binding protein [Fervidicoccus fontis]PMB75359.1 MAG: GTPase [Fervidicoccus fontis]PMB75501.1 MAG: GTPase [Fervidicoccus fontis]PMB76251.1 MAG: GTPase [Fervidicoccus fontis]PMB78056.1 MAG: GTPase [Fervidicoccus fontis]
MMECKYVVFMGPAGSGKTTLTATFSDWLSSQGIDNVKVNLDPAVEYLPYDPDIDVRNYVDAREVAKKYSLGPNGALLASMDLLYGKLEDIKKELMEIEGEYVLIDMPGQLELFSFRSTGPLIVDRLSSKNRTAVVFLMDANFTASVENFLSILMLSHSIRIRHYFPQINAISKIDLLSPELLEELLTLKESPELLKEKVIDKGDPKYHDYINSIADFLIEEGIDFIPVSSTTGEGLDELFASIQNLISNLDEIETNL